MSKTKYLPVDPEKFSMVVKTGQTRSSDQVRRIDDIFATANDTRAFRNMPPLRNDSIISVCNLEENLLIGEIGDYKSWYAQYKCPELALEIKTQIFAISGTIMTDQGWLLGKRRDHLVQYPGFWEFPPASSVRTSYIKKDGSIDLHAAFTAETTRELGIPESNILTVKAAGLAIDSTENFITELVIYSRLNCTAQSLAHVLQERPEHSDFTFVQDSELGSFIDKNNVVPYAMNYASLARTVMP